MLGLILAVLVGAFKLVVGNPFPAAYLSATNFLFWWYVAMAGFALLIVALAAFGITSWTAGIARFALGKAVVGLVGGMLGTFTAFLVILGNALPIAAAWLLVHAVKPAGTTHEWNYLFLALGALLIIIALRARSRK